MRDSGAASDGAGAMPGGAEAVVERGAMPSDGGPDRSHHVFDGGFCRGCGGTWPCPAHIRSLFRRGRARRR